jgi:hypothetical protein
MFEQIIIIKCPPPPKKGISPLWPHHFLFLKKNIVRGGEVRGFLNSGMVF